MRLPSIRNNRVLYIEVLMYYDDDVIVQVFFDRKVRLRDNYPRLLIAVIPLGNSLGQLRPSDLRASCNL